MIPKKSNMRNDTLNYTGKITMELSLKTQGRGKVNFSGGGVNTFAIIHIESRDNIKNKLK